MAKTHQRLTALGLTKIKEPGDYADGDGLYLQVTGSGGRSWIYRFALAKRRREMGLGPAKAVSLAAAREAAAKARALVKAGKDPIAARDAELAQQKLEEARGVTFREAAEQFLKNHEGTWRNPKHRQQWKNTLTTYVYPRVGNLWVGAVGVAEVTRILDPIWQSKPETAARVRGRIERVLDWAKARGLRTGENPARWRGHLDAVYPASSKVRKVKHHAAIPIDDMPKVYARLVKATGMAALAARFTILTAVRVSETTGGMLDEVNVQEAIWSISAARMKMEKGHRVPLSGEALAVLREVDERRADGEQLLFPGQRARRPLSLTSVLKALRAAGAGDATTHGCRSTFKDWATERTNFPNEVSEMALAHAISDKTERAYRRGELMEKRAALMEQWARFVSVPSDAKVVSIGEARRIA